MFLPTLLLTRRSLTLLLLLALPAAVLAQAPAKKTKSAAPKTEATRRPAKVPTVGPAVAPAAAPAPAAMPAPAAPAASDAPAPTAGPPVDPPAPMGFTKYYFVMLLKGPKLNQDQATKRAMMEGHLEYMEKLSTDRKCLVDGTFMDGGDWRGFLLVRAGSVAAVKTIADADPVVQAGRVVYEVHPWMTESLVFEK